MSAEYYFFAGVAFAGVALLFLWGAFRRPDFHPGQHDIVHFVCAFCGGAAGAFFTGSALLSLEIPLAPTGQLAIQGTAGVALFIFVFFIFRWRFRQSGPSGVGIASSGSNPFEQVAEAIAESVGATIDLTALTKEERNSRPRAGQLNVRSAEQAKAALLQLYDLVPAASMRKYAVTYDSALNRFTITV
jgi:hypothetical protein